ncbi:glycosyltransferase family protein [Vibrio vulnificus]|uniref:glycosyltransferase family protein n=1 Tax=Vibrio vulnificus TaxID=672 RepID=UPI00076B826E|nr:glycosyltransferase [Vibrio vulnificus]AMG12072.1 glycosyltransferase family 1 protein [Vibrio vulnificus]HAS8603464.1 glycosyltransferase family 1 protein [Vibrio vulnificus]
MNDMIVFAEDFGGLPSSTQHIVRQLAKRHRVLWVNSIGLHQPKWSLKDAKRLLTKLFAIALQKRQPFVENGGNGENGENSETFDEPNAVSSNIEIVSFLTIPAPSSRWARWLAKKMLTLQLQRKLKQLRMHDPIFWTSLPTAADLLDSFPLFRSVYYCGDDFASLAGVDHHTVSQHETKLAQRCDCILVASQRLLEKFPAQKTFLLPHGVDLELFTRPAHRADDLPTGFTHLCGFYGSLSQWLDYPLIERVASQLPHWGFVFIGPCEFDSNPLPKLPNVIYLGKKAHHALPRYSQHWDVSWLPFVINQQIKYCNPLKLLEYLAAGTPVLSKNFPAVEKFYSHLWLAENAQEMVTQLLTLQSQPKARHPLDKQLSQQSWEARARYVEHLVEQL